MTEKINIADLGIQPVKVADHFPDDVTLADQRSSVVVDPADETRKMKQIRAIYDSFINKDMPFDEFAKEFKRLMDPVEAEKELRVMLARRGCVGAC